MRQANVYTWLVLALNILWSHTGANGLPSNDLNLMLDTNKLPNHEDLPVLANGHLGFVVYGDTVYLNGVYNGELGTSHRARIPNHANIQMTICSTLANEPENCRYRMNMKTGMFETTFDEPNGMFSVTHQVYPNRFFDRTIVNHFRIQRLLSKDDIKVRIVDLSGLESSDLDFEESETLIINGKNALAKCGKTKIFEDPAYQRFAQSACIVFQEIPIEITCTTDRTAQEHTFLTTVSHTKSDAVSEITSLLSYPYAVNSVIERAQILEMDRIWKNIGIYVNGNDELDRVIRASAFYLSISLPTANTNQKSIFPFYGLSPAGLGRGGVDLKEYQGHNFWDTEMWMFPTILMFNPAWARKLLEYRTIMSETAADNANSTGYEGYKFPWESAFTGVETTQECCPEVAEYQHHITADVAFAARLYYYATHDEHWMTEQGCHLAYHTAKFWESRVEFNNVTDLYDIKHIMGPDEDHEDVANNVFTNINAANNLFFGEFAGCVCKEILRIKDDEHKKLSRIAKSITLLYDKEKNYHPQYEGYTEGTLIKQADVVLVGYPLQFPMDDETKRNNLNKYARVTRGTGPAMTWSMHAIGHLELNETIEAEPMFEKSYKKYVRAPFNVWNEYKTGYKGSANFITGAGGFLQSIIHGYGGVRLFKDRLEIRSPKLPPGTTNLSIPRISYLNAIFSIDVSEAEWTVTIHSISKDIRIIVDNVKHDYCTKCTLPAIESVVFQNNRQMRDCKLEDTVLGIKLSDQGGSSHVQPTFIVTLLLAAYAVLMAIL